MDLPDDRVNRYLLIMIALISYASPSQLMSFESVDALQPLVGHSMILECRGFGNVAD